MSESYSEYPECRHPKQKRKFLDAGLITPSTMMKTEECGVCGYWLTTIGDGPTRANKPPTLPRESDPVEKAWKELVADALASDGPIRDSDVKDAVKRNRPRIEAAIRSRPVEEGEPDPNDDGVHPTHLGPLPEPLIRCSIPACNGLHSPTHHHVAARPVEVDPERLRHAIEDVRAMDPLWYLDQGDDIDAIIARYAALSSPEPRP